MSILIDGPVSPNLRKEERWEDSQCRALVALSLIAVTFACQLIVNHHTSILSLLDSEDGGVKWIEARIRMSIGSRDTWEIAASFLPYIAALGFVGGLASLFMGQIQSAALIVEFSFLALLTPDFFDAVRSAPGALCAAVGLAAWYWPKKPLSSTGRLFGGMGLMVAVGVVPWYGICAIPALRSRFRNSTFVALCCGISAACWSHYNSPFRPVWIGSGNVISRDNVSLMGALQWLAGDYLPNAGAIWPRLGAIVLVVWTTRRIWLGGMDNARTAFACIGTALLATPGTTGPDAVTMLVPLALWISPLAAVSLQSMSAGWLLVLFFASKDITIPEGIGLGALMNPLILLSVVGLSAAPTYVYVKIRAFRKVAGTLSQSVFVDSTVRIFALAVLTASVALCLGWMSEDLYLNNHLILAAWSWPRMSLLALFVTAHCWCLGALLSRHRESATPSNL